MRKASILLLMLVCAMVAKAATPIFGTMQASSERMYRFVMSNNPGSSFTREIAQAFYDVGAAYGIRGDIALCQSCVETGWFRYSGGTAVTPDDHNYCGLGVTTLGQKGEQFSTIVEGVTAQIQHLWAYATTNPLPSWATCVDDRFKYVNRGCAPNWDDLGGKWATSTTYGTKILSIYSDMMSFSMDPTIVASKTSATLTGTYSQTAPTVSVTISASDLTGDMSVNSSTSAFTVTKSNWNARTGGTLVISLNTALSPGTYSGYVKVQSGSTYAQINLTGVVKEPPLALSLGWIASEATSDATKFGWDASKVRNFSYMNGKLYCVYNNSEIKVINSQTGADLGNLNLGDIVSGGTLTLCDVKCFNGHILACNLAASGKELRIYCWDNDQSTPYLLYSTTDLQGATRLGDCMEIVGDWSTELWLAFANDLGSETRIVEFCRKNGTTWSSKVTKATTDGSTDLNAGVTARAYPYGTGWWVNGATCYPSWVTTTSTGVATRQYYINTGETWGSAHHEFTWKGQKYAAYLKFTDRVSGDSNSTYKGGRMRLASIDSSDYSSVTEVGQYPVNGLGSTSRNTNVTGDVMINTDGTTYVEAWVCSTTHGMAYYKYGSVPAQNPSIIGPATPTITASTTNVSFDIPAWTSAKKTITITGSTLNEDIALSLSGSSMFSIDKTSISKSAGSATVTITYHPTEIAEHSATITCKSDGAPTVKINLSGNGSWPTVLDDDITAMTQVWNYSANGNSASWLDLTTSKIRSVAVLNGNLYALHMSYTQTPKIVILDAYTGNYKGEMSVDGLGSCLFPISSIIAFDGKIYGSGIATESQTLYVYRWDSDSSTPAIVLQTTNHNSLITGAQINASGTATSGCFWFTAQNSDKILKYTISNGTVSTTPTILSLTKDGEAFNVGDGRGSAGIQPNSDGSFWLAGKNAYPTFFDASGTAVMALQATALNSNPYGTACRIIPFGDKKYAAAIAYKSGSNNGGFSLIDITDGVESATKSIGFYPAAGLGPTANDQRVSSLCVGTRSDGKILDIWVSCYAQGVAFYSYNGEKASGVSSNFGADFDVRYTGNAVVVRNADVRSISIYSLSGALVAEAQGCESLGTTALAAGIYIAKVATEQGEVKTIKFVKR